MDLSKLPDRNRANLELFAQARGESLEATAEQIAMNLMRSVPRAVAGYNVDFSELTIEATGTTDGTPWVKLANGRIFYDHPAYPRDGLAYVLLRDRAPSKVTAETFAVAVETVRRYLNGSRGLPPDAKVAVEAGCYVGYKPIAFADTMGKDSQVVAIEMMSDNYALLERNVASNDLQGRVTPVHCALSDKVGTVTPRRKQKQQATIANADAFDDRFVETDPVPMDTLSNILDRTLPANATIDYLNVQVNGAELAALRGLGRWAERVRFFHVASPYTVDGEPVRADVVRLLESIGAKVSSDGGTSVKARGVGTTV